MTTRTTITPPVPQAINDASPKNTRHASNDATVVLDGETLVIKLGAALTPPVRKPIGTWVMAHKRSA